MKKLIAQGAEAKLYLKGDIITKHRFQKSYRLKELDKSLRKSRTKREAKVLLKLATLHFPSPRLIDSDDRETLMIEHVKGEIVKDILTQKNNKRLGEEIGRKVALLHNNEIIHGDLTTSNLVRNTEIHFIDFGLSFFSQKAEHKAVDLHVLKEALESKHHTIWETCFNEVLKSYKKEAENSEIILKRLEAVERRGRYRAKKGS